MIPPTEEIGIRLADVAHGDLPSDLADESVCIGRLTNHEVTEHEDGTITVRPSILLGPAAPRKKRHGYLTRGVWKEV